MTGRIALLLVLLLGGLLIVAPPLLHYGGMNWLIDVWFGLTVTAAALMSLRWTRPAYALTTLLAVGLLAVSLLLHPEPRQFLVELTCGGLLGGSSLYAALRPV